MDGETARALIATIMWTGLTVDQKTRLRATDLLPNADRVLVASIAMGSPYTLPAPDPDAGA